MMKQTTTILLLVCMVTLSCVKVPVDLKDNANPNDPAITFDDSYPVELATYKIDSFITSGHSVFIVGNHQDDLFGKMQAGSFIQVNLPTGNSIKDQEVSYDSLELRMTPNGNYYGDTLKPFHVSVHRLLEKIENEDEGDKSFYNPRTFKYDISALGTFSGTIRPGRKDLISVRLSDQLGSELLVKLRDNTDEVLNNKDFAKYFNGIYLAPDTTLGQSVFYFTADSVKTIFRLHYHKREAIPIAKYIDFPFAVSEQFNHINYNHSGTDLAVFKPFKRQLKPTSATGNKAFLHSNMGAYIKCSFPTILTIKELHPYVKVMKAELVISPVAEVHKYPYELPAALQLYVTDDNNNLLSVLKDITGQRNLTGDLFIDHLYGEKTAYIFNITDYINRLIAEGEFSESALMIVPTGGISDSQLERLVINDQTKTSSITLKLWVLGL